MKNILNFSLYFLTVSCIIQAAEIDKKFYPYYEEPIPSSCRNADASEFIKKNLHATKNFQLDVAYGTSTGSKNVTFETNKETIIPVVDIAWSINCKHPGAKKFTLLLFFGMKKIVDQCVIYAIQSADSTAAGYSENRKIVRTPPRQAVA